ncbi:MAG: 1-(5-phosphoribosyl)-5-[(5-phosphoribosylamino)methylideneamino]imidazole-4-carboxamide isomerase [Anaerolineae bacterium]|nr:1-(5-phosphoribosyl)-5-[(5-phosphoribosylamino)methylideneamino]imidazole-4-carboxamide isomerase [Anaerolineae bacterium]
MIVYPAIDLRGGKVVRLQQGDPTRETVYGDDPVAVAERWKEAGAKWLHVINLDGTLGEAVHNLETLANLSKVGLPIQFGGGLRTLDDAQKALDAGAARIILGTLVVHTPRLAWVAVERFGQDAVAVALDARDGRVWTHGWTEISSWMPIELGQRFADMGVKYALYTDITRDGELTGINVEATSELAGETGMHVIAAGGVAVLNDIRAVKAARNEIEGVVIGKALYTGSMDLAEALKVATE